MNSCGSDSSGHFRSNQLPLVKQGDMTSKKTKSHLFSAVAIGFMYIHAIYRVYIYIYIYFFFF